VAAGVSFGVEDFDAERSFPFQLGWGPPAGADGDGGLGVWPYAGTLRGLREPNGTAAAGLGVGEAQKDSRQRNIAAFRLIKNPGGGGGLGGAGSQTVGWRALREGGAL